MRKLVLIDGNSLLHRAYHAYPHLMTKEGQPTGAIYGFVVMMLSAVSRLEPSHLVIAWDVSKRTFRHDKYEAYKAGRPEMDQDLVDQMQVTRKVVETFNIPQFGLDGFEADDVIGTLAEQSCADGEVIIITGDRDALQLIKDKKIVVYMPSVGKGMYGKGRDRGVSIYDKQAVKAKYGLVPEQIIDLKALMGDSSDNVPGVKGVGQVTATKLLQERGSLEDIYKNIEDLSVSERIKKLLRQDKEMAFKSKELVTICKDVPIKFSWKKCRVHDYNKSKVLEMFDRLGFKSLRERLPADKWEREAEEVFG